MPQAKTQCTQCGAEILTTTARRTNGVCMPCQNSGSAPEWRRRQLWLQHGINPSSNIPWYRSPWGPEIITTCQALASGELDYIEAASKLAALSQIVLDASHGDKWLHKDWEAFFETQITPDYSERLRSAAFNLLQQAEGMLD